MARRARSKFRNVDVRYVYVSRKTGRYVSKRFSKGHRKLVERRRLYISKITKKAIKAGRVSANKKVQEILDLYPNVTPKGARAQLRRLNELSKEGKDILTAEGPGYQRWFRALYKEHPNLLPKQIKSYVESEYPEDQDSFSKLGLTL